MKINEVIRAKRLELGMTQEQVANRLGVSTPAVNKWERGASYPDITIIPAIARLLKTDANTLLQFQDDLSREQSLTIQREVDRRVREEGYSSGFNYATSVMREYPTCDQLACILTMYLDGAQVLYDSPDENVLPEDRERYREEIDAQYRRLATSSEPAVREMATGMLITQAMQSEDYTHAQELIDLLPDEAPRFADKEEIQAQLFSRANRLPEAEAIWARRVMSLSSELQTALSSMAEIAVEQGRFDDASDIARRLSSVMKLCDAPEWMADAALFEVAAARRDADTCISLLENMLRSINGETLGANGSVLYRTIDVTDRSDMAQRFKGLILQDLQTNEKYAFLRNDTAFRSLVSPPERG